MAPGGPRERKTVPWGRSLWEPFSAHGGPPPGAVFHSRGFPPQGKFQRRLSCAVFLVCSGDGFVMTGLASTFFECMGPNANDGFILCICAVFLCTCAGHCRHTRFVSHICPHHSGCDMMVGFTISLALLVLARCSGMLPTWIQQSMVRARARFGDQVLMRCW